MILAVYDIIEEPTDSSYDALLEFCGQHAPECSLVCRDNLLPAQTAADFLAAASGHLIRSADQNSWPGTKLSEGTALVFWYRVTAELIALLKRSARGLYEWQVDRSLPEDLAFYRADQSVLMGSISHERDAWLELSVEETDVALALPLRIRRQDHEH